jgi:hypothetical protein
MKKIMWHRLSSRCRRRLKPATTNIIFLEAPWYQIENTLQMLSGFTVACRNTSADSVYIRSLYCAEPAYAEKRRFFAGLSLRLYF